jgi:hypothetical protein
MLRNWQTQQTQNGIFAASTLFESPRKRLIPQKKTTATPSSLLLDFWYFLRLFEGIVT